MYPSFASVMLHGVATRGTVIVVGVTPPYSGALPQSTDTTAPGGVDRTGIFSVVSLTTVAHRAAETTTAATSNARFMAAYGTPNCSAPRESRYSPAMPEQIAVRGLRKQFPNVLAVAGVDLTVNKQHTFHASDEQPISCVPISDDVRVNTPEPETFVLHSLR